MYLNPFSVFLWILKVFYVTCSGRMHHNRAAALGNGEERYRSSPLLKRGKKTWQNIVICVLKTKQPTAELEFCKQTKLSLVVYNYYADLEVSDTCVRSSLLS